MRSKTEAASIISSVFNRHIGNRVNGGSWQDAMWIEIFTLIVGKKPTGSDDPKWDLLILSEGYDGYSIVRRLLEPFEKGEVTRAA